MNMALFFLAAFILGLHSQFTRRSRGQAAVRDLGDDRIHMGGTVHGKIHSPLLIYLLPIIASAPDFRQAGDGHRSRRDQGCFMFFAYDPASKTMLSCATGARSAMSTPLILVATSPPCFRRHPVRGGKDQAGVDTTNSPPVHMRAFSASCSDPSSRRFAMARARGGMIDSDNLKQVNDRRAWTRSRQRGCCQTWWRCVREHLRGSGCQCALWRREFILLLPRNNNKGAL